MCVCVCVCVSIYLYIYMYKQIVVDRDRYERIELGRLMDYFDRNFIYMTKLRRTDTPKDRLID